MKTRRYIDVVSEKLSYFYKPLLCFIRLKQEKWIQIFLLLTFVSLYLCILYYCYVLCIIICIVRHGVAGSSIL